MSGDSHLSLTGFRSADVPDVTAMKMVYSDYRVLTCSVNQAEYVYRLNSCFDCDQSGVGGQPMGFDQWKALYSVYRVVAVEVEVQAVGNGAAANGLLAVAPTDTNGGFLSAEEIAGLRHARGASFSPTQVGKVRALWRIGALLGRSDQTILADPNCSAAVTANPVTQFYLTIGIESGNAAAGQAMVWTKITYYVRFEVPIATLDASFIHRARFRAALPPSGTAADTDRTIGERKSSPRICGTMISAAAMPTQKTVSEVAAPQGICGSGGAEVPLPSVSRVVVCTVCANTH